MTPGGTEKLAIVHPGVQFLDYLRDVHTRMGYVPLLGPKEVAAITGHTEAHVRWLAHKQSHLTPSTCRERSSKGCGSVQRMFATILIRSTGTDPTAASADDI